MSIDKNRLGLQLWSVREQLDNATKVTIEKLANMGIKLVESVDLVQLETLSEILNSHDISVRTSFIQWSFITERWELNPHSHIYQNKDIESQFEIAQRYDLCYLINGYLLPEERASFSDFQLFAERLQKASELAKQYGVKLAYHNHGFEFELLGNHGENALHYLINNTDDVYFELDLMWAHVAGQDISMLIKAMDKKLKLLHLKDSCFADIPLFDDQIKPPEMFCALGQGNVPVSSAIELAKYVDYYFIEQDYSANMLADIELSQSFLLR